MTKMQYKILKYISRKQRTFDEIYSKFKIDHTRFLELHDNEMQKYTTYSVNNTHFPDSTITINEDGISYIEWHKKDTLRFWLPYGTSLVFSIAAFIISIIALITANSLG